MSKIMSELEINEKYLREHYLNLHESRADIANAAGVSPARIDYLLQKYDIQRHHPNRHGLSHHPLNAIWRSMRRRCNNPSNASYHRYGAEGIRVCEDWDNFETFYNWAISNGWTDGLSIDRIDNSRGYSPDNCRFVTIRGQSRNRTTNVHITVNGITKLQIEWAEFLGISDSTISVWKRRHGMDYAKSRIANMIKRMETDAH